MTGNIHLSERVPDAIGADDLNNYGVEIIKRTQNLQSNNNFHFLFLWGIANIKHAKVQRSKLPLRIRLVLDWSSLSFSHYEKKVVAAIGQ